MDGPASWAGAGSLVRSGSDCALDASSLGCSEAIEGDESQQIPFGGKVGAINADVRPRVDANSGSSGVSVGP